MRSNHLFDRPATPIITTWVSKTHGDKNGLLRKVRPHLLAKPKIFLTSYIMAQKHHVHWQRIREDDQRYVNVTGSDLSELGGSLWSDKA